MAWSGGRDQNHVIHMLKHGLFYHDRDTLISLLLAFDKHQHSPDVYRKFDR